MKSWPSLRSLSCARWNTNLTTWSPDYSDQLLLPLRQTHTQLWSIWTVELQTQTLTYSQTWSVWDGYSQSQTWSQAHPWTCWWVWFWTRTWILFWHCLDFSDLLKISSVQNEKVATQADQKWTPRWAWNEMLAKKCSIGLENINWNMPLRWVDLDKKVTVFQQLVPRHLLWTLGYVTNQGMPLFPFLSSTFAF